MSERKKRREAIFQHDLHEKLEAMFPGCEIFKMDQKQGMPDLLILYRNHWALLECKRWCDSSHRPNQDYWVDFYNKMSFARFINPTNEREVLNDLQSAFES